jgi:hypothetical protein
MSDAKQKEIPVHCDILGRTINVGDCVAMPMMNSLQIAKVSKLNPKMVQVSRIGSRYTTNKYPSDLVILDSQDVTMFILKMVK